MPEKLVDDVSRVTPATGDLTISKSCGAFEIELVGRGGLTIPPGDAGHAPSLLHRFAEQHCEYYAEEQLKRIHKDKEDIDKWSLPRLEESSEHRELQRISRQLLFEEELKKRIESAKDLPSWSQWTIAITTNLAGTESQHSQLRMPICKSTDKADWNILYTIVQEMNDIHEGEDGVVSSVILKTFKELGLPDKERNRVRISYDSTSGSQKN